MTIQEDILAICEKNAFMKLLGVRPKEVERDRVAFELTITQDLLNPYGIAHGGVLFSLADNTSGMAARGDGRTWVTLSSNFNFLRPGQLGDVVTARASVSHRGGTICHVDVEVRSSQGKLLASGDSMFYCVEK